MNQTSMNLTMWSVLFQRILEKVQQLLVELSEIEIDDINVNDGFGGCSQVVEPIPSCRKPSFN